MAGTGLLRIPLRAVRGPKPIMAPVGGLGGGFGSGAFPLLPYPYGSGVGRGRRCLAAAQQVHEWMCRVAVGLLALL